MTKKLTDKNEKPDDLKIIFNELKDIKDQLVGFKQLLKENQIFSEMLYKINEIMKALDKQAKFTQMNLRDCQNMLQEFKGIMCIVRPEVKKTGWYGQEVEVNCPKGDQFAGPVRRMTRPQISTSNDLQ
jgi:hypothetical protein